MNLHEAQSAAQEAEALAQAAERAMKDAAQKVKAAKKESRLAKLNLKQAKKVSKKAAKAARMARAASDDARRVSSKAAARASKAHAKPVKAAKEMAAPDEGNPPTPKRALTTPRRSAARTVAKVKNTRTNRAAASRSASTRKPAVLADPAMAPQGVDQAATDFDVQWTAADLKENDSLS